MSTLFDDTLGMFSVMHFERTSLEMLAQQKEPQWIKGETHSLGIPLLQGLFDLVLSEGMAKYGLRHATHPAN